VETYQQLISSAEWRSLYGRIRVAHLYGDANVLADLISRARWAEFRQLCVMLGVRPQLLEISAGVREMYRAVVACLRQRSHLAATARGVFNPNLIGDQPIAQDAASSGCAELLYARLRPTPPLPGSEGYGAPLSSFTPPGTELHPTALLPASGYAASLLHKALSPVPFHCPVLPSPSPEPSGAFERIPLAVSPLPPPGARDPSSKRRLYDPGPRRQVGDLQLPPAPPWEKAQASGLALASAEYARLRAAALAEGGEPNMAIRTELSNVLATTAVIDETIFFGINSNTLEMDVRAWEAWERVCRAQGTSPLRTAAEARNFPERNAHLLACLMLHAFATGRPRDRSRSFIKPKSALAYPLAIIRIFARWGVTMPSYKVLKAAVAGLARSYLAYHGPMSLAPKRAEPMKFGMVRELYAIPSAGTVRIGSLPWSDADHNVFIFRRLICVMMVTAFRTCSSFAVSSA